MNVWVSRHHTRVTNCSSDGSTRFKSGAAVEARLADPIHECWKSIPIFSQERSPVEDPRTAIVDNVAEAVPPAVGQPDVRGWVSATTVPW